MSEFSVNPLLPANDKHVAWAGYQWFCFSPWNVGLLVTLTKFIYIYTFWMFWPHKHADNILRHNVHSMLAFHRLQQGLWEGFHSCPSFVDLWLAWFLSKVIQQSSFWSYVWEKLPNSYYQIYRVWCCSAVSDSATAWTVTHQAPLPWDFPGKNL